ncbi:MAG: AMP-binding protein, partial [Pseudomonadota bacterium]
MFDDPFPEPFWARLEQFGQAPALKRYALAPENKVNAALPERVSYQDLAQAADRFVDETRPMMTTTRPLVVLEFDTCADHIAAYLGCLRAGWPVLLASPGQGALLADRFGAALHLFGKTRKHLTPETPALHPDLALLLPTSGTTGDAKLVRLSHQNLTSNADSIANYLHLSAQDCAATTLPLHYSYGLSVLHSTLATGGSLSLIDRPLIDAKFWQAAQATQVTSLALVPVQCEMLLAQDRRLKHDLPSLRYVTQAGGKLPQDQALTLAKEAKDDGWDLVIMYGQTEASPRMAYLPPEAALTHSETIGQAIPGGQITLQDAEGQEITEAGVAGELVYEGPNVMMGYARAPEDLAKPQGLSQLKTGDIAERTPDGFYKITGRAKRFVKIAGRRISLDGLESDLRAMGHAAYATGSDQQIRLYFCNSQAPEDVTHQLATRLKVPATTFTLLQIAEPPLMPSGKVDYRALAAL